MSRAIAMLFLIMANHSIWAQVSSPNELSTDFVLMCEEKNFDDLELHRLGMKLPPELTKMLFKIMNERNNNPKRPFFALKYVDKKLSYNKEGVEFLINEIPGEPNINGDLGEIWIKDDKIYFELTNEDRSSLLRTALTIDRFTGLYKKVQYSFRDGREIPVNVYTGKCTKYNERLF